MVFPAQAQDAGPSAHESGTAATNAVGAYASPLDVAPLYYVTEEKTVLYETSDTSEAYLKLQFRESLRVLDVEYKWARVRTHDGAEGYVRRSALSNVWISISRSRNTLKVFRGGRLVESYAADFGRNDFMDKEHRGSYVSPDHWRTPVGDFYVAAKNPESLYHKALVLNYPTANDARRGIREGIISPAEYEAIVEAQDAFKMPPMNTALGGWIEIHGDGSGSGLNWTHGCVAVHNNAIDEMWRWVSVGTPVVIEP